MRRRVDSEWLAAHRARKERDTRVMEVCMLVAVLLAIAIAVLAYRVAAERRPSLESPQISWREPTGMIALLTLFPAPRMGATYISGQARLGVAWHGPARHGMARQGAAWDWGAVRGPLSTKDL